MEKKRIEREMRELELKLHYHFNDVSWLSKAMGSIKIEVRGEGKTVPNTPMKDWQPWEIRFSNPL
jgi:predicted alpha/beta hydrolase